MIQKHKFQALDGIRGFAAIMVIFYHYSLPLFDPVGVIRNNFFFTTSYAFVDLFFVLSGFVITSNYGNSLVSKGDFKVYLIKRFARLYPLLLFTVTIYVLMKAYAFLQGFEFDSDNYGAQQFMIDTLEPLTFLNSTPLISTSEGMNPISWSISAEMIAYLVFGMLTLLLARSKWPFILLILLCVTFTLTQNRYLFAGDYGFVRGILGFSTGVLAFRYKGLAKYLAGTIAEILVVVSIVIGFYFISISQTELTNLLLPVIFFICILVFSNDRGLISQIFKSKPLQFLGKISYSIYLNHFIILWVYYELCWRLIGLTPSIFLAWAGIFVVIVTVITCSTYSYKFVEMSGMRKIKGYFGV